MPGPAAFFSTIGAVSAAGAAVYAAKMQSSTHSRQSSFNEKDINMKMANSSFYTSNKKLRLSHRNDIHVLMFVVGKD
ncbi:hypothetical protein BD408DRAFT_426220 [Parasitella parasitica]|nr:hypothetical protein BD408DRAFT_426220 [Parasitella parasitica]